MKLLILSVFLSITLLSMDAPQQKKEKGEKLVFSSQIAVPNGKDVRLCFDSYRCHLRFIEFEYFSHVHRGILGGPEALCAQLQPYTPHVRIWGITKLPLSNIFFGIVLAENHQQKCVMLYVAHDVNGNVGHQTLILRNASFSTAKAYMDSIDTRLIHLSLMLKQSQVFTKVKYGIDLSTFERTTKISLNFEKEKNYLLEVEPTKLK